MLVLAFSSKFDQGSYIVSIAKTASKKIRALVHFMNQSCFLSQQVYHTVLYGIGLVLTAATWNCYIGYRNVYQCHIQKFFGEAGFSVSVARRKTALQLGGLGGAVSPPQWGPGAKPQKILAISGPFRGFSMRVWQNAHVNTVRDAMVCKVYFPFSKILQLY